MPNREILHLSAVARLLGLGLLTCSVGSCDGEKRENVSTAVTPEPGVSGADAASTAEGMTESGDASSELADAGPPLATPAGALQCRPTVDGQRLKAIRWLGEDGSAQTAIGAWFDSEANVECAPVLAADGVTRCLPKEYAPTVQTNAVYYADSDCTQLVTFGGSLGCEPVDPKFLLKQLYDEESPTPMTYRVHDIGPSLGVVETLYEFFEGSCGERLSAPNDQPVYPVLDELPLEGFVALEESTPIGARIRDLKRTWSDGATDYVGLHYDTTFAAECRPLVVPDAAFRCIPGEGGGITYVDPECSDERFFWQFLFGASTEVAQLGGETVYYFESRSQTCDVFERKIYRTSELVEATGTETVYGWSSSNPTMCISGGLSTGWVLGKPGSEIPNDEFVAADLAPATCDARYRTGSRLQALAQHWSDGATDTVAFFDTELETKCELRTAGDGQLRCLPSQPVTGLSRYVDAECTRPAARYQCAPNPGDGYDHRDFALESVLAPGPDGCYYPTTLVYEVFGPVLDTIYQLDGDGCSLSGTNGLFFRELGAEIPPETFVAFACSSPGGCTPGVR